MEPQNEGTEPGRTPGEWLSQARVQQGLTRQQAAERLNLDVWVVDAVEANRFSDLGPPVYAKGHLRKYAAVLGLPVDEVLARYEELTDTPTVQDPIPATVAAPIRQLRGDASKWPRIIAGLVITAALVALAFVLFKYNKRSMGTDREDSAAQITPPVEESTTSASTAQLQVEGARVHAAEVAAVPPASSPSAANVERSQSTEPSTSAVRENMTREDADAASVTIRLDFSDTSWTEVYDAVGKRLMFDNGGAGRARTLTGAAPLHVTVGLASGVKLEVNGRPAVIPRRASRESARFTVAADGTVSEN